MNAYQYNGPLSAARPGRCPCVIDAADGTRCNRPTATTVYPQHRDSFDACADCANRIAHESDCDIDGICSRCRMPNDDGDSSLCAECAAEESGDESPAETARIQDAIDAALDARAFGSEP